MLHLLESREVYCRHGIQHVDAGIVDQDVDLEVDLTPKVQIDRNRIREVELGARRRDKLNAPTLELLAYGGSDTARRRQ